MVVKRNVEGLRNNAQKKHQEALDKVERGIKQLLKDQKIVNFNTVAQASGVSKAWLYKDPGVKARIESLRENNSKIEKLPPKQRTSDASKDAIIKTLKERTRKLEAENKEWREQNEVVYGRILKMSELEHRIEILKSENTRLKNELAACQSQPAKASVSLSKTVSLGEISEAIKNELESLGIKITSTLASKICNSTEDIVLNAIAALEERVQCEVIKSPGAWLAQAIEKEWQPNQPLGENNQSDSFAEWYDLAREQGLVVGSRKDDDGSIWVQDTTKAWIPHENFSSKWTIEYLRSRKAR